MDVPLHPLNTHSSLDGLAGGNTIPIREYLLETLALRHSSRGIALYRPLHRRLRLRQCSQHKCPKVASTGILFRPIRATCFAGFIAYKVRYYLAPSLNIIPCHIINNS